MARVTAAEVQEIIETDSTIDLTPFITTANILVTKHCAELNSDYTAEELEQIELYLSAHIYTLIDPRASAENIKGLDTTYQSRVDLGFATSHYGQTAMLLDWYGGLAALNERIKAGGKRNVGIDWLGTESEELDEE